MKLALCGKINFICLPAAYFRITCDTRIYSVVYNKQDIFGIFISLSIITHKLSLVFVLQIIQFCKSVNYLWSSTMIAPRMDHSVGSTIHTKTVEQRWILNWHLIIFQFLIDFNVRVFKVNSLTWKWSRIFASHIFCVYFMLIVH